MDVAALPHPDQIRVAVIGLGYVGLPLAVGFGRVLPTLGFDINAARVAELREHRDHTLEVSPEEFASAPQLSVSADPEDLRRCNVFIVTVPTPIDDAKRPDLRNTRVVDVINEFKGFHANVDVHDPWVSADEARHEYGLELVSALKPGHYDAIVLAVGHRQFAAMGVEAIRALGKPDCVLFDVKQILPRDAVDDRL